MLLLEQIVQAPKFQHITLILKSLHWLKVSERIQYNYKIISLTKFSISLRHRIALTSYLFSLFPVTTHALHLMSLSSNHHHHSKSLIDPSDMLHLIFGTIVAYCAVCRITTCYLQLTYALQKEQPSNSSNSNSNNATTL